MISPMTTDSYQHLYMCLHCGEDFRAPEDTPLRCPDCEAQGHAAQWSAFPGVCPICDDAFLAEYHRLMDWRSRRQPQS